MRIDENTQNHIKKIFEGFFFLMAFSICMYYIWSDYFILETNQDVLDNVMWAQATEESGQLINPDYTYPYFILLGGHLLMVPFIKIFGLGVLAARAGMTIFITIFVIVTLLFFYIIFQKWNKSIIASGIMLLSFLGTEKLREMFLGHVLHYSLGIMLWMLAIIIIYYFEQCKDNERNKKNLFCLLLTTHFFICGLEGLTVVMFSVIPILGYIILEYINSEKKIKDVSVCDKKTIVYSSLGCLIGIVFYKFLTSGHFASYQNMFMTFEPYEKWGDNLSLLFSHWFSLFMEILPNTNIEIFSVNGFIFIIKLVTALILLFSIPAAFLMLSFKKIERQIEKKVILSYGVLTAEIVFLSIFGSIGTRAWRILPLWFGSFIMFFIVLKNIRKNEIFSKWKRIVIIVNVVILFNVMINSYFVLRKHVDLNGVWFGENTVIGILEQNELSYGYAVNNWWISNSITVITNEEIIVREMTELSAEAELIYSNYQNCESWYEEIEEERFFVIIPKSVLEGYIETRDGFEAIFQENFADRAIQVFEGVQYSNVEKRDMPFYIFVFSAEEDIFCEELSGLEKY